jgi:UvrB/uvrC motif
LGKRVSKDISKTLDGWDYDPDRISVRIVKGDDGREKIQLRLDLGLLQMEFEGRPDGKRVGGCASWLEFFERQQQKHDADDPNGPPFLLETEDCQRLLREGVQYYHRYVSFWHLERYELCARDTNRNLRLFAFVRQHARHKKDKLQFDQWRPYVTMMHARAVATPLVGLRDYQAALGAIDAAIEGIRDFLREYDQLHNAENCSELEYLLRWREEIAAKTSGHLREEPYNPLARLQSELELAVSEERFEDAARLRDTIRQHSNDPGDEKRNPL